MLPNQEKTASHKICPGLGLAYDPSEHRMVVNPLHYCYYQPRPDVIPIDHQESYCLTRNHTNCPIYQKKIQTSPPPPPAPAPAPVAAPKSNRLVLNLSNARLFTYVVIALLVVLIILLVLLITSPRIVEPGSDEPLAVTTYIITPTQITPNATWYAQLTQDALQAALLTGTPTSPADGFPTRTSIAYQSPTVIICSRPDGWIIYPVHDGDTLRSLAMQTNITVVDLMFANCLTTNTLAMGQEIFLPYYPGSATATGTPRGTSTRTRTATATIPGQPTTNPGLPTKSPTTAPTATIAIPTNTNIPPVATTRNPLFRDTPTPSDTPPPTATPVPPTDTETPVPTETQG